MRRRCRTWCHRVSARLAARLRCRALMTTARARPLGACPVAHPEWFSAHLRQTISPAPMVAPSAHPHARGRRHRLRISAPPASITAIGTFSPRRRRRRGQSLPQTFVRSPSTPRRSGTFPRARDSRGAATHSHAIHGREIRSRALRRAALPPARLRCALMPRVSRPRQRLGQRSGTRAGWTTVATSARWTSPAASGR